MANFKAGIFYVHYKYTFLHNFAYFK